MSSPTRKPILIVRLISSDPQIADVIYSQAGAGPTGLVLALTLAKNGVPVRIVEKDTQYHVGQRGPGIQPRTLEIFHFLGVLNELVKGGGPMVKRCIYEMPEGRKPLRMFEMAPVEEPTPSVPYVSCFSYHPIPHDIEHESEESDCNWATARRGNSARPSAEIWR